MHARLTFNSVPVPAYTTAASICGRIAGAAPPNSTYSVARS